MGFLSSLGSVINETLGMGENSVTSLDSVDGSGRVKKFGLLGDFSNKFDHSAERSYIEDGFIMNVRPRMYETTWQQPDISVIIKKRMFSSLAENYKLDFMDAGEKLFMRASKKLFQNKCRAIAVYEKLTKIEQMAKDSGHLSSFMFPMLMSGIAELEDLKILPQIMDEKTHSAFETLRKVYAYSEPSSTTRWMIDHETAFMSDLGEGSGVIELTMISSVSTHVGLEFGGGGASLTIEDPYKLMVITSSDIDLAIKDATNIFKNSGPLGAFGTFAEINLKELIEDQKKELNDSRRKRRASDIAFIVTPVTIVSKKVRAILQGGFVGSNQKETDTPEIPFTFNSGFVGFGSSVEIDPVATEGPQGLTENEQGLFKEIIKNIYLLLSYEQNTRSNTVEFNAETNLVRQKMMLHFGGKSIIQSMDIVNIFCSSKTMYDEKLIQGFELKSKGLTFADRLDSLVRNINTTFDKFSSVEGGRVSIDEIEKAAIAGPEFPTWLWRLYRNDFTRQGAGLAIFVGLVKNSTHSYNDGKYVLNVSCEDNSGYFNKSQINLKPSVDVANQVLYDPLTPFKVSFDASTGAVLNDVQFGQFPPLLDENNQLLQSEAVKFHTGRVRGQPVDSLLYQAQDGELSYNSFRRVLNDPLGFVYRWKEGIGTYVKTEQPFPQSSLRTDKNILLTNDPFAGQDVMNVLSLLVTGQPYNYNTFLKAAIDNANSLIDRSDPTNKEAATTYIESLSQDLSKRNALWGNFIPFKKLSINKDADSFIRSGISDFMTQNNELTDLIQQRAGLLDKMADLSGGYMANPPAASRDKYGQFVPNINVSTEVTSKLEQQISELDVKIASAKRRFSNTITNLNESKPNGRIKIIGDDISLDPGYSNISTSRTEEQRQHDENDFRRKIGFLTQRRLWKVKANEDNNLFVVDDQYDKNFDIQAFERSLSGKNMSLFNSEYVSIDTRITNVAKILGLEIFADTQGNIQVRPPLYNRMPSSVFYRMFKQKAKTGIQVFPQFLESLLFNQLEQQINRIEIIEDQIRLRALAMGVVPKNSTDPDKDIAKFIRGNNGDSSFAFLSNYFTGKIANFNKIMQQKPEFNEEFLNNSLQPITKEFNTAAKATRLFDAVDRVDALNKLKFNAEFAQENDSRISDISKRLSQTTGEPALTARDLFSSDQTLLNQNQFSQMDAVKILKDIASYVSERQNIINSTTGTLGNLTDGIRLNDSGKGATAALFPSLNRKQAIPGILQHMIEYEDDDDLGPNSGNRFVIKDRDIISLTIEEHPPDYTMVQVNGLFGDGFQRPPESLAIGGNGGNEITSAFAVDYDLWRMYGFRVAQPVETPFFSNPQTQCSPFAVYLLNRARRNILIGSVNVSGNEYYQPGDVVYIEDRDLLFYVTNVKHDFTYGGRFTTSLELKYGHVPGDYIPTILDIVGKYLYKSKDFTNFYRSNRNDTANGEIPVSVVLFDRSQPANTILKQLLSGNGGKQNIQSMTQMLFATSGALNRISFSGAKPVLKIRIYTSGGPVNSDLQTAAKEVVNWLQNPQKMTANNSLISINNKNEGLSISVNAKVEVIDVKKDFSHTPSTAAWNTARTFIANNSTPSGDTPGSGARLLDNVLYSNIIDAWLTFEEVEDTIETGGLAQVNQAAQETTAKLNDAAKNFAQFGRPGEV